MLTQTETYNAFRDLEKSCRVSEGKKQKFLYTLHIGAHPQDWLRKCPVNVSEDLYAPKVVRFSLDDFFDANDSTRDADFEFLEGDCIVTLSLEDERYRPIAEALRDKALRQYRGFGAAGLGVVKPECFIFSSKSVIEVYDRNLNLVARQ